MITILGASGNTGSKIANMLLDKNVSVRAVGRNASNLASLVERGAEALIGNQHDPKFLASAFMGSDAAYALIPTPRESENILASFQAAGEALITAIKMSGLKKLVFLSSFGAERPFGNNNISALHAVEKLFSRIANVHVVFLRTGYFYENTLHSTHQIKHDRIYGTASDPQVPFFMASSHDVANKAVELLSSLQFRGHTIAEVFSDRLSHQEITDTIRKNIGLSKLPSIQFQGTDGITSLTNTGTSAHYATMFLDFSIAHCKGFVRPIALDPLIPNGETRFDAFVKDTYVPAYLATP